MVLDEDKAVCFTHAVHVGRENELLSHLGGKYETICTQALLLNSRWSRDLIEKKVKPQGYQKIWMKTVLCNIEGWVRKPKV